MRCFSRRSGYLDPATGSYVLQMAVAGILAAFYALRNYWAGFFRSREEPEDARDPEVSEPELDENEEEPENSP
jgi:hypothetical protein